MTFNNREEAAKLLAEKLSALKESFSRPIVLGIPRGGVSIGYYVARALAAELDAIVLRKLPSPGNPEMGFGAVTLDKSVIFNEPLLAQINLAKPGIDKIIDEVYEEVLRRNRLYRGNKPAPLLARRSVIITDDGLATGFTMLAAVRFAKERKAAEVIVAVPVAHRQAYGIIEAEADRIIALEVSDADFFAVASFYRDFTNMSDDEIIRYLENKAKTEG